ncbi:MAG: NAD+ synthase [Pseudomonadota bacterium]
MDDHIKIAICQIEPTVGDIKGNKEKILAARLEAAKMGADLCVFCELVVSGYPPEDLVQKPAYQRACARAVEELASATGDGGPAMIVGAPHFGLAESLTENLAENKDQRLQERPFNAVFLLADGVIVAERHKKELPNYGVFDEPRRFTPGEGPPNPIPFRGLSLGLLVCEDMWRPGVAEKLAEAGADLLIAPHGSPFRDTARNDRASAARKCCQATGLPIVFVNQLAGQDEIVFDGASFVMAAQGDIAYRAKQFLPGIFLTEWKRADDGALGCIVGPSYAWHEGDEEIYRAVVLGVRDYVEKNRFPGVVIGLSGGVDSALTAAIAVDALGANRVRCVMLPSRYTSKDSLIDAEQCAKALGVQYDTIQIEPTVAAFGEVLGPVFNGRAADTTEENIQSRIRGVILMALSNKFGEMVLTTGNKSEMSVGYATLYGDMNGGYNPLKDIYKTDAYNLCHWRNSVKDHGFHGPEGIVIPENIITKAPSAELREDQTDQDSLPPYDVLDGILERLVEREMSVREIIADGFDEDTIRKIEHLLYVAEYKRRQAPPGPKVTQVNFGRDRRYPITNGWRDRGDY